MRTALADPLTVIHGKRVGSQALAQQRKWGETGNFSGHLAVAAVGRSVGIALRLMLTRDQRFVRRHDLKKPGRSQAARVDGTNDIRGWRRREVASLAVDGVLPGSTRR